MDWGLNYKATVSNDGRRQTTKPLEIMHSNLCGPMNDVVFMKDSTRIGNDLKIHSFRGNKALMVVGMDEYSASPLFDFGKNIEDC